MPKRSNEKKKRKRTWQTPPGIFSNTSWKFFQTTKPGGWRKDFNREREREDYTLNHIGVSGIREKKMIYVFGGLGFVAKSESYWYLLYWYISFEVGDMFIYSWYPPGNDHISHQTEKEKSSTQKCWLVGNMLVPWRVVMPNDVLVEKK